MTVEAPRKVVERELHDFLRGDARDNPDFNSNKKFYAVNRLNEEFVRAWLTKRCVGKVVLDYCCGNGEYALVLAAAGADAHGIDISPVSIDNARREAQRRGLSKRSDFRVMDAESMEYADGFFDLIVINGVLHHLDLQRAYQELARVLKPHGAIIVTEALRHNPIIHWYRKRTPHLRSEWETEHILGKAEVFSARRYFGEVRVERFFHLATLGAVPFRDSPIFVPLLKVLQAIDSVLLHLPVVKWQAWMVVFVLKAPGVLRG